MTGEANYGPFIGKTVVSIFAFFWVSVGTRSLGPTWSTAATLAGLGISAAVGWHAFGLVRAGGSMTAAPDWTAYVAAVAFELITIPLAAAYLRRTGSLSYLLPVVAFLVGIHFFGLIRAFHTNACGWIGALMCLLAVGAVTCLPAAMRPARGEGVVQLWDVVVGVGCAVILWGSAVTRIWG